jgi:hypothetical protein
MDSYLASAAGYRFLPPLVIIVASVAYRLPRLISAGDLHSDSAVVGLQAAHFLRGEWSPLLWGSGYQTSVDSGVAALFFAAFGPTPLSLRLSTFVGFVVLTLLVYATLRRHLSPLKSALLVSPLVLTPTPVHTYVFSPPRQAALTLVFLAIFLFDGAALRRKGSLLLLALGTAALGLSVFADPYALLFLPSIACVAIPAVFAGSDRGLRAAVALAGGAVGILPFVMLLSRPESTHGVFGLAGGVVVRNARLLLRDCLPFLLSLKVFVPGADGTWTKWTPPTWFSGVQVFGAVGLVMAIAAGGGFAALRTAPPALARLGMAGATMLPIALIGFVFSVMPMDQFSARYLVAIILMAPFALSLVVERIGLPVLAAVLLPYLASSAVAGWLGYGSEAVRLGTTVKTGQEADDRALIDTLRARGIRHGLADYWASYRLTFLSGEQLVIVPWHETQDRYAPYREAVRASPIVAFVYHPVQSLESLSDREALFRSGKTEYSPDFETVHAGRYTVFVLRFSSGGGATQPVFRR